MQGAASFLVLLDVRFDDRFREEERKRNGVDELSHSRGSFVIDHLSCFLWVVFPILWEVRCDLCWAGRSWFVNVPSLPLDKSGTFDQAELLC